VRKERVAASNAPDGPPTSWAIDEGVNVSAGTDVGFTEVVEDAGHFRIYLGAAAGVGKTYAMLSEGIRRAHRGTDVVVGFVETHGRPLTEGLVGELEVMPRRSVEYRGSHFEEMDVDAVLARKPKVALVDELAHSNVPGSGPNEKRWQDIFVLLNAGIDVITTVNIQHLESIADAVEQMVGVKVHERVPDWVVRKADQIELVDSSPEQLRRRMVHGNIYPAEKVPQALTHFFRADNLIALRELALRFLADESEEELIAHLQHRKHAGLWETSERIMVGVTPAPGTDVILRRAARITARSKGDLHAVHVVTGDLSARAQAEMAEVRRVAEAVGAEWVELHDDDVARAMIEFARRSQITQIVLGASRRGRWREMASGGSIVWKVQRLAAVESVDVHIIARHVLPPGQDERDAEHGGRRGP
jgi:two-component system sensor histidine kinase KdpD